MPHNLDRHDFWHPTVCRLLVDASSALAPLGLCLLLLIVPMKERIANQLMSSSTQGVEGHGSLGLGGATLCGMGWLPIHTYIYIGQFCPLHANNALPLAIIGVPPSCNLLVHHGRHLGILPRYCMDRSASFLLLMERWPPFSAFPLRNSPTLPSDLSTQIKPPLSSLSPRTFLLSVHPW